MNGSFPDFISPKKRFRKPNIKIEDLMKLPTATIVGFIIAVASKFLGAEPGELHSFWDGVMQVWPLLVGAFADVGSFLTTLKSARPDKGVFRTKTFWLQLLSGVMVIIGAFGIDVSGAQPIVMKVMGSWDAVWALIGSALVILGRIRLKFLSKQAS